MSNAIIKKLHDEDIKYVDLRFTDPRGKLQHVTFDRSEVNEDFFEDGVMFDGSSIAGWKAINESDMVLKPDPKAVFMDPFYQQPTMIMLCDILEPGTGEAYNRDPRTTAKKAESFLTSTGIGDTVYLGPEAEFFVFDDVRYSNTQNDTSYSIDDIEMTHNSGRQFEGGNMAHRPGPKGGYFPVDPVDTGQDMRTEMLTVLEELGLRPEKHHHEVAPAQHEPGMKFDTLTTMADRMQMYKYTVKMVAKAYGKTATFMPKPMWGDNGTGMHVHQSIWKGGNPVFAGDRYADLSETCLHYIGGIIKHARAINAFANSTTNSYKRLVPGFEAPALLAYSARNRSASIRIPWVSSPKAKRLETRFPDPAGNPYLTFAALLMAGLDGIENRIDPGDPMDKDLYDLPPQELQGIPTVCRSLREALESLDADRDFLKKGGVMDDDQIDAYIELKYEEVLRFEMHPHPVEFDMYYSS